MMSSRFPHLFSALQLGAKTLKHRLNFGAHTANMAEDGLPTERHLRYYAERARGGAAMIVVEPVPVHRTGVLTRGNFRHDNDSVIPSFRRLTEACHAYGTVMIQQLYHVGAHGDYDNSLEPNWSPSGFPSFHDADGSHAMSEAEIEEVVECFAQGARRAHDAGFDGVELMAGYNALIEQFWMPLTNRRSDRWGGAFENRMRFSTEVTRRIRAYTDADFVIGLATSIDDGSADAFSLEALCEVASYHDAHRLIDYITIGTGSYFDHTKIIPHHLHAQVTAIDYAATVKGVVKHIKVQAEAHVRTPARAEAVIAANQADMVSIVRGQIADPHLARKAMNDHPEDIRPCISCNQGCWARRSRDYHISCLVNPAAGRECETGTERDNPAASPRQVLVVGGGPAGMETARVAAERGHRVTLVERSAELGGAFRLAGEQPSREQIGELLDWYTGQLQQLQVVVQLNTEADSAYVRRENPDIVIVATGARPARSGFQRALPGVERLPGVDEPNVHDIRDLLDGSAAPGRRILLVDDTRGWPGAGTALWLAERGHQVTLLTAAPLVAAALAHPGIDGNLRTRLARAGVTFVVDAALLSWEGSSARIRNLLTGVEDQRDFDALVLATTDVANDALATELSGIEIEVHTVGDCVAPRRALAAIYEGRRLGLKL